MKQNNISELYFKKTDLNQRISNILIYIKKNTDFLPKDLIQKSSWWNSKHVGAMHFNGTWKGRPAVFKIQGEKPETSEVEMITAFDKQNKSKVIRAPEVFTNISWDKNLLFEGFVMEDLSNKKVIGSPASKKEMINFFKFYKEYKLNCVSKPWLEKPNVSLAEQTQNNFNKWRKIAKELKLDHPLKKTSDDELIDKGLNLLVSELKDIDWQFQHGHFSTRDLYKSGRNIILLSNLYWSWRMPFYDAVFGFHWYQYDLASSEKVSLKKLIKQRNIWKEYIETNIPKNKSEQRLLKLAFLERSLAGLNLDGLLSPSDKSEALMEIARKEISTFS